MKYAESTFKFYYKKEVFFCLMQCSVLYLSVVKMSMNYFGSQES